MQCESTGPELIASAIPTWQNARAHALNAVGRGFEPCGAD